MTVRFADAEPNGLADLVGRLIGANLDGDPARRALLRPSVVELSASDADIFATIVPEDTYAVASEIHDLLVKTHIADREKIEEIKALVWEHLFIDRVLEVASEVEVAA